MRDALIEMGLLSWGDGDGTHCKSRSLSLNFPDRIEVLSFTFEDFYVQSGKNVEDQRARRTNVCRWLLKFPLYQEIVVCTIFKWKVKSGNARLF